MLKEVERRDLALALKGASPVVSDKFFGNMSTRAAGFLRDDMEAMGPVRLSDVETAQEAIMAIALKLEESGDLMFLEGADVIE
jgi:flagellar motor switch protein FliG